MSGFSGGVSSGGGGGGGVSVPAATLANAVLQVAIDGTLSSGPLSQDQIGPLSSVALTLLGSSLVDVGQRIFHPQFTAAYVPGAPAGSILTDDHGTAPLDVTGTPNAFTSLADITLNAVFAGVTYRLDAHQPGGVTKFATRAHTAMPRIYWGVGDPGLENDLAFLHSLQNGYAFTQKGTFNFAAPSGKYIYLAYRDAWGPAVLTVGGLPFGYSIKSTLAIPNPFAFSEPFRVLRSDNSGLTCAVVSS